MSEGSRQLGGGGAELEAQAESMALIRIARSTAT